MCLYKKKSARKRIWKRKKSAAEFFFGVWWEECCKEVSFCARNKLKEKTIMCSRKKDLPMPNDKEILIV